MFFLHFCATLHLGVHNAYVFWAGVVLRPQKMWWCGCSIIFVVVCKLFVVVSDHSTQDSFFGVQDRLLVLQVGFVNIRIILIFNSGYGRYIGVAITRRFIFGRNRAFSLKGFFQWHDGANSRSFSIFIGHFTLYVARFPRCIIVGRFFASRGRLRTMATWLLCGFGVRGLGKR